MSARGAVGEGLSVHLQPASDPGTHRKDGQQVLVWTSLAGLDGGV